MTLLHIDSSIMNEQSVSRQLTAAVVKRLTGNKPATNVQYIDLAASPLEHLTAAEFLAPQGVEPQGDAAKQAVARNSKLVDDFLAAETVVVGAPMYNFTLPSQLRTWLDRLAAPGRTFRYGENGPEGLAGGKRVIVVSTRGGLYGEGSPTAFLDHQETYLRGFFGFLGITDVTFVRAEGLAMGPEARAAGIKSAEAAISALGV